MDKREEKLFLAERGRVIFLEKVVLGEIHTLQTQMALLSESMIENWHYKIFYVPRKHPARSPLDPQKTH